MPVLVQVVRSRTRSALNSTATCTSIYYAKAMMTMMAAVFLYVESSYPCYLFFPNRPIALAFHVLTDMTLFVIVVWSAMFLVHSSLSLECGDRSMGVMLVRHKRLLRASKYLPLSMVPAAPKRPVALYQVGCPGCVNCSVAIFLGAFCAQCISSIVRVWRQSDLCCNPQQAHFLC